MSSLRFCLLVAVLFTCSHLGGSISPPPKPSIIFVTQPSVTPPIILPLLGEESAASGSPSTSNSVPSHPTTSEKLVTSTSSSDADASVSSSSELPTTTPAPEPSPAPAPAPTPAPGPVPPPDQGIWAFPVEKANVTCMVVQFAAQLNVTYSKLVQNATSLAYVLVNVPANATVSNGSCDPTGQWLTINWTAPGTLLANNMTLVFNKNDTSKDYTLKSLNISLTPELLFNTSSKDVVELYHGIEWQTPLATSYRCSTPTNLNMTSDSASVVAVLTLSRLQEEAFRNVPGKVFSAARECGGGDVPDAVPIAVGCALGGLVLIVLGAYLVARKRSAARGYLSM